MCLQDPLKAHWACSQGAGMRWQAPPPGWSTHPGASNDGGGGAWQTLMLPPAGRDDAGDVRTMTLQVPLSGPLM